MAFYSQPFCMEPRQKGIHSTGKLLHEPELMHLKILLTVFLVFRKGLRRQVIVPSVYFSLIPQVI